MTDPSTPRNSRSTTVKGGALIGLVGIIAAAGLYSSTPREESSRQVTARIVDPQTIVLTALPGPMHLRAYRDVGGVWTVCDGDTANVGPNTVETPDGCTRRTERQLVAHALPVKRCLPSLWRSGADYQRWAIIDLAYNAGAGTVCGNTGLHRLLAANRWLAAADRLLAYDKIRVNGRIVVSTHQDGRRHREREVFLTNLIPAATPANLPARVARWRD